ncbi:MAG: hypothetical protein LBN42_04840 [Oscillospiraceae bacterium]|jgi:hypothetical protein|nr:hypothetical protein [Oscillospiraceae bacterium]
MALAIGNSSGMSNVYAALLANTKNEKAYNELASFLKDYDDSYDFSGTESYLKQSFDELLKTPVKQNTAGTYRYQTAEQLKSANAATATSKSADEAATRKSVAFKSMVQDEISKQASPVDGFTWSGYSALDNSNGIKSALDAAAATSVGKDYWSADALSDRIVTFAKGLAGDSLTEFNALKDTFTKAFDTIKSNKGGKLPQISEDTKTKVLSAFETAAKELAEKAKTTTTTTPTTSTTTTKPSNYVSYTGDAKYGASFNADYAANLSAPTTTPSSATYTNGKYSYNSNQTVSYTGDAKYGASYAPDYIEKLNAANGVAA